MDKKELLFTDARVNTGQIIDKLNLDGPSQMAADMLMLKEVTKSHNLSLSIRFYTWEGVWLSIGHHQKIIPKHWLDLVKKGELNIVRRPSGGSSVLHTGGLTYSIAWHSPPRKKHQAYREASKWLIEGFLQLGMPLRFGNEKQSLTSANCFATSSAADLVDSEGIKRIGSAQVWKNGNLLQHGEILLDPPKELWQKVFNTDPPKSAPISIPRKTLDSFLKKSLISQWSKLNWSKKEFNRNELIEISKDSDNYSLNLSNSDF